MAYGQRLSAGSPSPSWSLELDRGGDSDKHALARARSGSRIMSGQGTGR